MKKLTLQGKCLVTGPDAIEALRDLAFHRAMIITGGSSMFRNGTIDQAVSLLRDRGEVQVYSGIGSNPTCDAVLEGLAAMRTFMPDLVIAIGGGSPLDAAKAMLLFYEFPALNFDNVFSSSLPQARTKTTFVAIPSTSGTASEVTHVTVVTFPAKKQKLAIKTEALRPDIAILDGVICQSLPAHIAAETGMDALTHAIECYTNRALDDFTGVLAKGAIEGILAWLPRSVSEGDLESRQKMHDFSCMAGMAFSNTGLGMVHGISHAFSGAYNTAHGLANAVILPFVLEFNRQDPWVSGQLETLSRAVGSEIITKIQAISKEIGIPSCLQDAGISEADFKRDQNMLIDNAMLGSTAVNPIPMTREMMVPLIRTVYYGA